MNKEHSHAHTQLVLHNALVKLDSRINLDNIETVDGICHGVTVFVENRRDLHAAMILLGQLMEKWPKSSDDASVDYPVPSPYSGITASQMYHRASSDHALWDTTTPYGILRIELLHWLIEQTKCPFKLNLTLINRNLL